MLRSKTRSCTRIPYDGGSKHHRNVGKFLPYYAEQHPKFLSTVVLHSTYSRNESIHFAHFRFTMKYGKIGGGNCYIIIRIMAGVEPVNSRVSQFKRRDRISYV